MPGFAFLPEKTVEMLACQAGTTAAKMQLVYGQAGCKVKSGPDPFLSHSYPLLDCSYRLL